MVKIATEISHRKISVAVWLKQPPNSHRIKLDAEASATEIFGGWSVAVFKTATEIGFQPPKISVAEALFSTSDGHTCAK